VCFLRALTRTRTTTLSLHDALPIWRVGSPTARREERGRQVAELLLGEPEPLLEDEPHLLRGGAPERATRDGVRLADLLAHLVHRLVRLLLRGDVDGLGADLGRLARRGV